jgi:hypothetical protein
MTTIAQSIQVVQSCYEAAVDTSGLTRSGRWLPLLNCPETYGLVSTVDFVDFLSVSAKLKVVRRIWKKIFISIIEKRILMHNTDSAELALGPA